MFSKNIPGPVSIACLTCCLVAFMLVQACTGRVHKFFLSLIDFVLRTLNALNTGNHSLMKGHPNPPAVIVVSDSDQDDCGSQSDASIVSLILSTVEASGPKATSRHDKSKLMQCDSGLALTTDTGIRRRPTAPTGSQLHEVIVIDCDESSDTPLVRFYVTLHSYGIHTFAAKTGQAREGCDW